MLNFIYRAVLLVGVFSTGCIHTSTSVVANEAFADSTVSALLTEDYEAILQNYPIWASMRGERRFDTELSDPSPRGILSRLQETRQRLKRAKLIEASQLSREGRINLSLLIWELEDRIANAEFRPEWTPITQMGGPHTSLPQLPERITFTSEQHFKDYVVRLTKMGDYFDQVVANLQAGVLANHLPPKVVMAGVMEQMKSQIKPSFFEDPSLHSFYKPFVTRSNADPLAQRARDIIRKDILPAMQRLSDYLENTYIPACRNTIAAKDGPGGLEYYQYRLRHYTTLPLTAKKIHEMGQEEVARIRQEMMETIKRSDFNRSKNLKGAKLFEEFVSYLRTDKRFYYESADEMLRDYSYIAKAMDAELPKIFGTLPRLPYGIKPMPSFIAQSGPTAYYYEGSTKNGTSGTFIVNTSQLDQRPKYEMKALTYHEAMPGHHLQIALSQELGAAGLHPWREMVGYTVFVEGWGLYSERLGLEVGGKEGDIRGFYQDPYDDFGRLTYEMWRALRLVVDTGIHAFDWSRERAIDYMLENSALTRKNIENEVDRYISWPGQAVAYKVGELRIRKLRQLAEDSLNESFDIRDFHDVVLSKGALPLGLLDEQIKRWIKDVKSAEKRVDAVAD